MRQLFKGDNYLREETIRGSRLKMGQLRVMGVQLYVFAGSKIELLMRKLHCPASFPQHQFELVLVRIESLARKY